MAFNQPFSRQAKRSIKGTTAAVLGFILTLFLLSACSPASEEKAGGSNPDPAPAPDTGFVPTTEWKSADIGGTELGETEYKDGEFKILGSGDLSDSSDAFHFTYQEATNGVGIVAQLSEHGATLPNSWPKAGITVRGGLEPGAPNITVYAIDNDQFQGLVVQQRSSRGEETTVIDSLRTSTRPLWLRIRQVDNRLLVESSASGDAWDRISDRAAPQFGAEVFVGMMAASGHGVEPIEATFREVRLVNASRGGETPAPPTTPSPTPPPPSPTPTPTPPPAPPTPMPDPNPGPKSATTYQIDSSTDFLNPERGFHSEVDLMAGTGFDNVRNRGYTLVRAYVRLDAYRDQAIPASFLSDLGQNLARARTSGIKIILRFSYNFGNAPDAPLHRVLQHIEQLQPVLRENADVIAVLQAGFIGGWGEWHSSTNGLATPANKKAIGEALLAALPESRMIQVRAPFHRRDIVGSPSPDVEIFGPSSQARIGFKNDCFLSDASDTGTYAGDQTRDRNETAQFAQYTVTGGETCTIGFPSARQDCSVALRELAEFSWDYLNSGYYGAVLNRWRDQGCFDEISRRLGYRLGLESGAVTADVQAGGTLTLDLTMRNDGFGKVYNPRPIDIVLQNVSTGSVHTVRATSDARRLLPLAGARRDVQLSVELPSNLQGGDYDVFLSLPDASSTLASDPRYNLRLANVGMWQEATGLNDLGLRTTVGN